MSAPTPSFGRPRVGLRDLLTEAVAGVVQRPLRSVLTGAGAAIGVCAVVTVLGLTGSASARVNERFDALRAREITVTAADGSEAGSAPGAQSVPLPVDAAARVAALPGVVGAGFVGSAFVGAGSASGADHRGGVTTVPLPGAEPASVDVRTVDVAAWPVLRPGLASGRLFDAGHEQRADRVAVLGAGAAHRLGVSRLDQQPAVFVDGVAFTVIGVVDRVGREPDLLGAVMIPPTTAREVWSAPAGAAPDDTKADDTGSDDTTAGDTTPGDTTEGTAESGTDATLLVETELGAATVIAQRIPYVVDPAHPERTRVQAPPDPKALSASVGHDLDVLSLALAAVSVLLGALGISNTMLVTVMERVHEIGLRRALGAGSGHIATQFLAEAGVLGGVGGLVGSSIGVVVVLAVAIVRDWTPVLAPSVLVLAPLLGLASGLVAGVFPALRAARVQPADALRR